MATVWVGLVWQPLVEAIIPEAPSDQYRAIPERNVFGLRPPPTPAPTTNPAPPLPKITLTGITTILDNKRALMKVAPTALKPGDTNKEWSLILTEGQREGDIEVLQIDERAGSVKVNNAGTVMVLTFEKDGAKLPTSTLPPGIPGALPGPPTNPLAAPAHHGISGFPQRNPRSTLPAPGLATTTGAAATPVGGVPTPTGFTPPPAPSQDLTPEEQAIIIELQRQANVSNSQLLPPTPLSPANGPAQPIGPTAPGAGANNVVPGTPRVLVPQ